VICRSDARIGALSTLTMSWRGWMRLGLLVLRVLYMKIPFNKSRMNHRVVYFDRKENLALGRFSLRRKPSMTKGPVYPGLV